MKLKTTFVVLLTVVFALHLNAQEAAAQSDILTIKKKLNDGANSFNKRNLDNLKNIFADDFIASYPEQPDQNKDATLESYKRLFENTYIEMKINFKVLEIESSGELAYVRLREISEVKPKSVKTPQYGEDTGIQIWKKQTNGDWKISRSVMFPLTTGQPAKKSGTR